ncbi:GAF domain-containing protein [Pseudomonas viridiflava]|uniref:GAF domain-containing protein n=1 Tax=Pseudomonas viridiflava TaxID=33069 RepID=UPI000F0139D4|nr:GAF domain-containing protein [Pseudomonas viridiflava]
MDLFALNQKNKKIESSVFSIGIFSANTWMTLAAPLIIGIFASKLFAKDDFSGAEATFFAITLLIHIVFAIIIFVAGNRRSTTLSVDEAINENTKYKTEVIPRAKNIFEVSKTQQSVTYLMTVELESIIDEVKCRPEDYSFSEGLKEWDAGLNRILWHLVEHRTQLFGYKPDAFYNFALYLYDKSSDELFIKWRDHDNRLVVSNRRWKPGFGHVGLAFIQAEAKICQDITISSELSDGAIDGSDKKKYRSFISVPIKDSYKVIDGQKPLGVLVFTSNHVGQFSWERDKIFTLTVAKILSMYIERHITALVEDAK